MKQKSQTVCCLSGIIYREGRVNDDIWDIWGENVNDFQNSEIMISNTLYLMHRSKCRKYCVTFQKTQCLNDVNIRCDWRGIVVVKLANFSHHPVQSYSVLFDKVYVWIGGTHAYSKEDEYDCTGAWLYYTCFAATIRLQWNFDAEIINKVRWLKALKSDPLSRSK